jgi:hypothetical protein
MLERPKKCLMGFFWWQTQAREDVSNGFVDEHHPIVINVCHCSFLSPHENGRKGGNYCSNL